MNPPPEPAPRRRRLTLKSSPRHARTASTRRSLLRRGGATLRPPAAAPDSDATEESQTGAVLRPRPGYGLRPQPVSRSPEEVAGGLVVTAVQAGREAFAAVPTVVEPLTSPVTADAAPPGSFQKAAGRGVAATTMQTAAGRILGLVGFTVLARFLSPADYGTAALANVFVALLATVAVGGLGGALVQREHVDREYANTAFWLGLGAGLSLTACMVIAAFPLASLFHQPRIGPVLLVLSVNFTTIGASSVQTAMLQRALRFGVIAKASIMGGSIATVVGIVFAVLHFGVWALVVQTLLAPLVSAVMLWRASTYRPGLAVRRADVKPIYRVSSQFLGSSLLDFFSQRTDDFLVGARLGATALGLYSIAFRIVSVMIDILSNGLRGSTLSIFSRLQSKHEELRRYYFAAMGLSGLVVMPCFAFVFAAAPQVVIVVFGSKWHAAVPLLRVFAVYGGLEAVMIVNQVFLQGAGAAGTALRLSFAGTVLQIVGFFVAFRYGLIWISAAYVLRSYVIAPFGLSRAARIIGTGTWRSIERIARPGLCSLAMAVTVYVEGREIPGGRVIQLLLMTVTGFVLYLVLARVFMRSYVQLFKNFMGTLRRKSPAGATAS